MAGQCPARLVPAGTDRPARALNTRGRQSIDPMIIVAVGTPIHRNPLRARIRCDDVSTIQREAARAAR